MSYAAQVADLLGAVRVGEPGSYRWFGRRLEEPALARRLLTDFYETGAARPAAPDDAPSAHGDGGELAAALAQANRGRGCWQPGWKIGEAGDDGVAVMRSDGLRLFAPPQDCREGDVRVPKDLRAFSPGLYAALGDAPPADGPRVRLSWNLAAAGAVTFVARMTYVLNGAGLPFTLALPAAAAGYRRRDAACILLARDALPAALSATRPLLRALGPHLADGTPALTKPLARGLAVSDEPAGGESFGEHRCGLLADAIVAGDDLDGVRARFAAVGLSLDAPYLEPGSVEFDAGS